MVHGRKCAQLQIYFGASLYMNTFALNKDILTEGTKPYKFCKTAYVPYAADETTNYWRISVHSGWTFKTNSW